MSQKESMRHWKRLQRLFSAISPVHGLIAASVVLGVDRSELRRMFDRPLTSAQQHALNVKLLAAADRHVEDAKRRLAESEALREECWIAERVSHRDAHSTIHVDLPNDSGLMRRHRFFPWEAAIAENFHRQGDDNVIKMNGLPRYAGRLATKPHANVEVMSAEASGGPVVATVAETVATVAEAVVERPAIVRIELAADEDDQCHPVGEFDDDGDDDDYYDVTIDHDDADEQKKPLPPAAPWVPTVMYVTPGVAAAADPVADAEVETAPDAEAVVHPAEAEYAEYLAIVGNHDEAPELKKPLPPPARPLPTVMHAQRPKPPAPQTGIKSARVGGKLPFPTS